MGFLSMLSKLGIGKSEEKWDKITDTPPEEPNFRTSSDEVTLNYVPPPSKKKPQMGAKLADPKTMVLGHQDSAQPFLVR